MKCTRCGADLSPNDSFCGSCGNRITQPDLIESETGPVNHVNIEIESEHTYLDTQRLPFAESEDDFYRTEQAKDIFPPKADNQQYQHINDTQSGMPKIFHVEYEDEKEEEYDKKTDKKKGSAASAIAIILVIVLLLFGIFTAFNFVVMTDKIDVGNIEFLKSYKDSLGDFLNISDESEDDSEKEEAKAKDDSDKNDKKSDGKDTDSQKTTVKETVTETTTEATTEPSTEPTTEAPEDAIPSELQKYSSKLVPEGKKYKIKLNDSKAKVNYRSAPEFIDVKEKSNNILGKLGNGDELFVEYIYDGVWAVYKKDGKYVFSSMYDKADSSQGKLMVAE